MSDPRFGSKTTEGEKVMARLIAEFIGDVKFLDDEYLSALVSDLYRSEGELIDGVGIIRHIQESEYDVLGGENWFGEVYKIERTFHDDIYIQISGYYVSHDGGYYNNFSEVVPNVKTVTVFE